MAVAFAVAALVSVATIYSEFAAADPSFEKPSTPVVVVGMLGVTLPLAWRRRFPLAVTVFFVVAFLVDRILLDLPEASITVLAGSVALYSAAAHGNQRYRTVVLALCFSAILAEVARELFFLGPPGRGPLAQSFLLAYNAVALALPWLLGAAIRSLRERERDLADRAAELQREREENARQAVFAERVRIARELHDVVAHHVSVMGVQAGAAGRVMARHPEKASAALRSIETSSRQAVSELHRLLGFLRRSDEPDQLAPQPTLAELPDLVAQAGRGELDVRLVVEGDPVPLSPTLEVSAYRIIQEALTNVRKHSSARCATVHVRYQSSTVEVEVTDDGPPMANPVPQRPGHGLIGMRERASLHHGHLRVGPLPDGRFVVHAAFPLTEQLP
ncbi:MAG: histidine kinase [Acidimicrobiales bacterium]|nr:histidine kinase [Acidimicrobiales bacterium]